MITYFALVPKITNNCEKQKRLSIIDSLNNKIKLLQLS
jgi:hypothetical protein